MPEVPLTVASGDVALEGALLLPEGDGPFATVVICHPHPQHGGSMDSNVVAAAAGGLRARGLAAVLFNFRGVGGSGGIAGDRAEARADVAAVRAHASTLDALDAERIGLAGYSFGAAVAASAAGATIPALALIALPISMAGEGRAALAAYPHPLLLLSGDHDQGSDAEGLTPWRARPRARSPSRSSPTPITSGGGTSGRSPTPSATSSRGRCSTNCDHPGGW